ncbi:MAG: hypothetical protein HRT69_15460, partial [Flavobacteriaceae bacterium]|nr:hypothetical protein [Flavobacteriaceae bacterium]
TGDVATLPVGYRPSKRQSFNAIADNGVVRVDIATNGNIILMDMPTGNRFSLSGIMFRAVN